MIQTLATQGADQSFRNPILPGRPRRDRPVAYPHGCNRGCEDAPIPAIIVAHQISRRRCPRKGFRDLLGRPSRRRIPGDLDPEQPPKKQILDFEPATLLEKIAMEQCECAEDSNRHWQRCDDSGSQGQFRAGSNSWKGQDDCDASGPIRHRLAFRGLSRDASFARPTKIRRNDR